MNKEQGLKESDKRGIEIGEERIDGNWKLEAKESARDIKQIETTEEKIKKERS